jgi:hypothetical protein
MQWTKSGSARREIEERKHEEADQDAELCFELETNTKIREVT